MRLILIWTRLAIGGAMTRPVAVLMLAGLVLAGCGDRSRAGDGQPVVVASFYPIAEAARQVGGSAVHVVNLTPAGVEPHDLELTPDQVAELENADLVLYLGQGFQPAVEEVVERRDGESVDLLADLPLEPGDAEADDEHAEDDDEHEASGLDPHFWLDPTLFARVVDRIEAAMADVSPDEGDTFAANADDYRSQLSELDQDFETGLADCARREIVTAHAAFYYLAERYELTQLPISGVSPEEEPTPDRLAELSELIEDHGVTTVFYESLVPPDLAQTLAREAGVDTAVLDPIEGLNEEAVADGATYASVMRDNLAALQAALGCDR
jgi:zinc transport system substrate-binding protein